MGGIGQRRRRRGAAAQISSPVEHSRAGEQAALHLRAAKAGFEVRAGRQASGVGRPVAYERAIVVVWERPGCVRETLNSIPTPCRWNRMRFISVYILARRDGPQVSCEHGCDGGGHRTSRQQRHRHGLRI